MPTYSNYRDIPALVRDRKDFKGNTMSGANVKPGSHHGAGLLNSGEMQKFFADSSRIDYIVWSYATPIAWHRTDGTWYRVSQKWGVITSKHKGRLYLI